MVRRIAVVVDTNVYFSALHNLQGNEAEIIKRAKRDEVVLFSPDTVREELRRNLIKKLGYTDEEISNFFKTLPTIWIPSEEYSDLLPAAKKLLEHLEDSPLIASALKLSAAIVTGNKKHFDRPEIRDRIIILSGRELLDALKKISSL